ncbi:MAG: YbjN domain-containing protein [Zoogloeaceae bacterium]|nr:YbjN domain-containing protein [Zoogloeaceae bacterium]
MKHKLWLFVALLFSGLGFAQAEEVVFFTPEMVLEAAKGFGSAELTDGHVIGRMEGIRYGVFPRDCKDGRCDSLQFAAGWKDTTPPLEKINAFNRKVAWGTAYLDKDGDLAITYYVEGKYGMSKRNLEESFKNMGILLKTAKEDFSD